MKPLERLWLVNRVRTTAELAARADTAGAEAAAAGAVAALRYARREALHGGCMSDDVDDAIFEGLAIGRAG